MQAKSNGTVGGPARGAAGRVGLLSVSFGTSHADTQARTIDVIDAQLREEFSDYAFYSAWTSPRIIAKVQAERGEHHDTVSEALSRAAADGVRDVVVATTCLMDGGETRRIREAVQVWVAEDDGRSASLALPLLSDEADRRAVAQAVRDEFSYLAEKDALVLMGHGMAAHVSKGHAEGDSSANEVYVQIEEQLHELGCPRFFVATVEGQRRLDDVLEQLAAAEVGKVYLAPLMIVAGDHAKNDLAGDGDSWARRLCDLGYDVEPVLKGLGEYAGIRDLVCAHARSAAEGLSMGSVQRD